jgi:hypothetical protein
MSSEIERLDVHYKQPLYEFLRWCYSMASHTVQTLYLCQQRLIHRSL